MSLLDRITESATKAVADDKWFDAAMKKAREAVPADRPDDDPLTRNTRVATIQALETLEKHRDGVKHLGVEGLTALMAHLSLGRLDDAARVYLRQHATLSDLVAASTASNEEVLRRARERKKTEAEVLAILKTIGSITARYVLPALLAAL